MGWVGEVQAALAWLMDCIIKAIAYPEESN